MDWFETTLKDAIDRARRRGADISYNPAATWTHLQQHIWFRLYDDNKGRIHIERLRHWTEGYTSYSRIIDRTAKNAHATFKKTVDAEISMIEYLQRMDELSVKRHGNRFHPVQEMVKAHPVGLALSRHMGLTDDMICQIMFEKAGNDDRPAQDRHGVILRPVAQNKWKRSASLRQNHILFDSIRDDRIEFSDRDGRPTIIIYRHQVPETALLAMKSMPLSQAINHPGLIGIDGIAILHAQKGNSSLRGEYTSLLLTKASVPIHSEATSRISL